MISYLKKEIPSFQKYMLFQEADGEESDEPDVVEIKRKKNFLKGADMTEEEDSVPDEPATDDTELSDSDDTSDDDSNDSDDSDTSSEEPTTDDSDMTGDDDNSDDGSSDDSSGESDEPVTDDSDMSGDDDSSDSGDSDNNAGLPDNSSSSGDGNNSELSKDEQLRKYMLYQKFLRLKKVLVQQSDTLDDLMSDDMETNLKYKKVSSNLKELSNMLSEFMILKFQTATYVQSMLFFQRVMTATDINVNTLKELQKNISKNVKK